MRFTAQLEKAGDHNQWTIVRMPFDVGDVFGLRLRGEAYLARQVSLGEMSS